MKAVGAPSQVEAPKGKRAFVKDHMNVATGQARLFGSESEQATKMKPENRKGKRILMQPHLQNKIM